jgi:hypothetical protein
LSRLRTHRLTGTGSTWTIASRLCSGNRSAIATRWHRRTCWRSRRRVCRGCSRSWFPRGRLRTGLWWTNSGWNSLWRARKRLPGCRSRRGRSSGPRGGCGGSRCWSRRRGWSSRSGRARCRCSRRWRRWLRHRGSGRRSCRRNWTRCRCSRSRCLGLCRRSGGRDRCDRFRRHRCWCSSHRSGRLRRGFRRLLGHRRCRRGFRFRTPLKRAANFLRDIHRDGTRVCLLLGYTKSRQQVDNRLRLDLQLPGQFVNSDL